MRTSAFTRTTRSCHRAAFPCRSVGGAALEHPEGSTPFPDQPCVCLGSGGREAGFIPEAPGPGLGGARTLHPPRETWLPLPRSLKEEASRGQKQPEGPLCGQLGQRPWGAAKTLQGLGGGAGHRKSRLPDQESVGCKAEEGAVGPQDRVRSEPWAREGVSGWLPPRTQPGLWTWTRACSPTGRPRTPVCMHLPAARAPAQHTHTGPWMWPLPSPAQLVTFHSEENARRPLERWEDTLGRPPASPDPPLPSSPTRPAPRRRVKASCHDNPSPAHPSRPAATPGALWPRATASV